MVLKDPLDWHCFCFGENVSSCSWLRELTGCLLSICSSAWKLPVCHNVMSKGKEKKEAEFDVLVAVFKCSAWAENAGRL